MKQQRTPGRLGKLGLAGLAAVLGAAPTPAPTSAQSVAELQTGVPLCAPTFQNRLTSFKASLLYLNDPKERCWVWDDVTPGFTVWLSRSGLAPAPQQVIVVSAKGKPDAAARPRIFLRIVGGPGASIGPGQSYGHVLDLIRSGDVLVTPAYEGTVHGTFYPNENFTASTTRIAAWLRELRRRNPLGEVVLIGESLGGPLALEANRLAGAQGADRIVLLAPLAFTPDAADRNFTAQRGERYRNDRQVTMRIIPTAPNGTAGYRKVYSTDLFISFFPAKQRSKDLGERLKEAGNVPILLVYGSTDMTVGTAIIEALPPAANVRVVRIADMPHKLNTEFGRKVTAAVIDYLDGPGHNRP